MTRIGINEDHQAIVAMLLPINSYRRLTMLDGLKSAFSDLTFMGWTLWAIADVKRGYAAEPGVQQIYFPATPYFAAPPAPALADVGEDTGEEASDIGHC